MKKAILVLLVLTVFGCVYGERYWENPRSFIRDPHFTEYKEERDALELQYLDKKITYAEYLDQMKQLDETYTKEVQTRDKIIRQE